MTRKSVKTILFLVIEGNDNKGCGGSGGTGQPQYPRLLEDECKRFLSIWYNKTLNQDFSEIETHLVCSSNNPPREEFINHILKQYPLVIYTHCPHKIADSFPAGWFNTPLAGKWLEENIEFDTAIHLDLDMILLKKFDSNYLVFEDGNIANCAIYHPDFPDDKLEMHGIPKQFVTCFITTTKAGLFYSQWWDIQLNLQKDYEEKYGEQLNFDNTDLWWDYCNIEEHAVDIMYFENNIKMGKVEYCQFGNTQGYGSISENIDHIDKLNFLHCHINDDWKTQMTDYTKEKLAKMLKKA